MTNSIENIGLMIRNERLRKGLTQEELGRGLALVKLRFLKLRVERGLR